MNTTPQLAAAYGFALINTGGGCTAFSRQRRGWDVLITDGEASAPVDASAACVITFYDANGYARVTISRPTLYAALKLLTKECVL